MLRFETLVSMAGEAEMEWLKWWEEQRVGPKVENSTKWTTTQSGEDTIL